MADGIAQVEEKRGTALEDLKALLRIPSMSSLPECQGEVQRAAEWCADRLRRAGFEHVEIMPTGGHPIVYGDWLHSEGKPTVLVYGHFDVQPADPLELWTSPPFEPVERDGRLYARGASDMKATLVASIAAAEALLKSAGSLPVNLKFFLEGQEEIGSPQLPAFVAAHRELLAADLVVSGDGGQWSETEPAILVALRGGCSIQVNVQGANTDLHSGLFGGAAPNANHALVRILDSMRSPEGKILVEGFYDDVLEVTQEGREQIAAVPWDDESYKADLGVSDTFGEPGYSTLERLWTRPTLEINGMWGGFQGEGVKTVTPNLAHAKINCRLVPDQHPAKVKDLIAAHVRRNTPPGVTATVERQAFEALPYHIPPDHWANRVAAAVLTELYGREPYYVRMGASVPVCETFLTHLGVHTVSFGFSQSDEQFHAPNEFVRVANFELGQRAWGMLLEQLGSARPH